jgi:hypothetical protein
MQNLRRLAMPDDDKGIGIPPVEEPPEAPPEEKPLSDDEKGFRDFVGVEHTDKPDPAWDNKRFRQIYRKHKDEARTNEELKADIRAMADHNKALYESVNKLTDATGTLVQVEADKHKASIQDEIASIEGRIDDLKAKRKDARIAGDWEAADKIDDAIDRQKESLSKKRAESVKKPEAKVESPPSSFEADMKVVNKWTTDTPWFNPVNDDYDPLMVTAAREMDTALQKSEQWKDKPVADRLKAVQERIEKRFNYKGKAASGNGKGDASLAEGVGNEGPPTPKGKVILNDDEKRVARRMFSDMTAADAEALYSKQKIQIGRA